jgi:type II secretory pathway pseudopilin PulG
MQAQPPAPIRRASIRARPRGGFTLIEAVIVFSIVSVLVAMAAPLIDVTEYRMNGAVREVAATLAGAQQRAVLRQHDVIVSFDAQQRWLRIHADADNDGDLDVGELVHYAPLGEGVAFGLGSAPPRPHGSAAINFDAPPGELPRIVFHRNGSASESGGFYLTSERALRSGSYSKDSRSIEIERATGRVAWYRYDDKSGWRRVF